MKNFESKTISSLSELRCWIIERCFHSSLKQIQITWRCSCIAESQVRLWLHPMIHEVLQFYVDCLSSKSAVWWFVLFSFFSFSRWFPTGCFNQWNMNLNNLHLSTLAYIHLVGLHGAILVYIPLVYIALVYINHWSLVIFSIYTLMIVWISDSSKTSSQ